MIRHRPFSSIAAPLLLLLAVGCARDALGPEPVAELTPISIRANTAALAADVGSITIEVTGSGIPVALVVNLADGGGGAWSGTLEVPVGSLTFTGTAYDDAGVATHTGSTTKAINSGANSVSLTLEPLGAGATGTVSIDVTLEDSQVQIALAVASIAIETSTIATGTVTGLACTPSWASTNPAIATVGTVTATGGIYSAQVHARSVAGTTRIVINCGGVAASTTLTVVND